MSGIAVTPTLLNYGYVNGTEVREILVVNNLEESAVYNLSSDSYPSFEPKHAYLEPSESQLFKVVLNSSLPNRKTNVYIDEIREGSSIMNSIRVPLKFSTDAKKIVRVENKVKLEEVKFPENNSIESKFETVVERKRNYEKVAFFVLGGVIVVLFLLNLVRGWMKRGS